MLPHPRMPLDIPRSTSHILVLRKVTVPQSTERNDPLLTILLKYSIPLLASGPRAAQGLEPHCKKK